MTATERAVFDLLEGGATTAAMAEQLRVIPPTVRSHVSHVLQKLGLGHTTDKHQLSDLIRESTDAATGNVMLAVTGLTFRGSENASLPLGAVYNSLSGASNAVPAPGTGTVGNGAWQFTAGGGVRLMKESDSSVVVVDPSGATRLFCCEPVSALG